MVSRRRFLLSAAASAPALALHAQEKDPAKEAPQSDAAKPSDSALPAPILSLKDRSHDIVPIAKDERQTRLDLARELMKQYGMNAILISTGASLRYFTGMEWGLSERLFCYVLPQSAAPFIVCPYFEREHLNNLYMRLPERETTITYLWQESEDPYKILQRGLAEYSLATGTLGIEEKTPYAFISAIGMAAPALKLVSATPVTAGCRSLKSPAEIALMRLANQITFDVYKAVYQSCGPGDTNLKFAALAAARPGVEMQAIDAAAREVIVQAGFGPGFDYFTHRLGHGIGMDMHEWPYLVGGNTQKLVAGMTFSNEPGIYLRGNFGIRLEDDMLITENGAELFTSQSPDLLDPFAIPAIVAPKPDAPAADKPTTPDAKPDATKPADTQPAPSTTPNP